MNSEDILNGAKTAFISKDTNSSKDFRPKLLYNDKSTRVVNAILDELHVCDEFVMSSAFITMNGLMQLIEEFRTLEAKKIQGKILTTDYLYFTEPKALRKLQEYLGVTKENTMAFGDNLNDIGMLRQAAISYAVEEAREEVREAADAIAGSCKSGGVLGVLKKMEAAI